MRHIAWTEYDWSEGDTDADPYPELREVLAPELAELPAADIESAIEALYGGEISAEDLESFWRSIKRAGSSIGRTLQKAAPGIGQVARVALPLVGTAFAGPVGGALLGAAGQGLAGALARGKGNVGRRVLAGLSGAAGGLAGALPGRAGQIAGRLAPGLAGAAGRGGVGSVLGAAPGGAAGQFVRTMALPQTLQALTSLALGPAGRRQVSVGGTPVPVASFANLLGVLANQAAAEHHALVAGEASGTPAYLLDDAGEAVGDPSDPLSRAEVLLVRLAEAELADEAEFDDAAEAYEDGGEVAVAGEWEDALEIEEAFWSELALAEAEGAWQ